MAEYHYNKTGIQTNATSPKSNIMNNVMNLTFIRDKYESI